MNSMPIINGLSDFSFTLVKSCLMFLTITEKLRRILKNQKICWVGDYNNVLRSLDRATIDLYIFKLNIVLLKRDCKKIDQKCQIIK